MNRFERLFFILEKNPAEPEFGNREVRGVVKLILTAEQIRVMWELSGLPIQPNEQYAICIFLREKDGEQLTPKYFSFQPNAYGNVRMENLLKHALQEGETVFGVALTALEKKTGGRRKYPLVAFQNMKAPWQSMLQKLEKEESPSQRPQKSNDTETNTREQKFNNAFVFCDPFGTTNPSYRWWRSSDMHQVNRTLAQLELTLPLEVNKDGYLACGIFGHVLLGLYTDHTLQREFFVLGIPAKSKNDAGNYYSHSRWEAVGRPMTPEQEETGYWLTYIDCNTSKVVRVV